MCFWPLFAGRGEPEQLRFRAGRIDLCGDRVSANQGDLKLFGSKKVVTDVLCQYEFCLELNSYLAVMTDKSPESAAYVAKQYPDLVFNFWPCLIAFPFKPVVPLALKIYKEISAGRKGFLGQLMFDPALAGFLTDKPGGLQLYGSFLRGLVSDQSALFMELRRFPPMDDWPTELAQLIDSRGAAC
jgi:hypothetical protein